MQTVRIGMVGSGYMGRSYAECLKSYTKHGQMTAVTGGSRAEQLAADYQAAFVADYGDLLARANVDAVLIATPHKVHLDQVTRAAGAGKHVLVEKPMALDAAECDAMIAACRKAGVTLSVIQTVRFRGTVARGWRMIQEGKIGKVRMIDLRTLFEWVPTTSKHWTQDPGEGGLILDQGAHNFDFMRWYAGSEARTVFGRVKTYGDCAYPFPTAMADVEFQNGVLAHTWMSFELPKPGLADSAFRALVVGETGMLDIDGFGKLSAALDGNAWQLIWQQPTIDYINKPLAPERLEAFYTQVQDFIDSVRLKRPPAVSGEDGRAAVALIDACRKSNASGAAVNVS
ncbi:MAG: Gfo/Idh/MocA family oxidoreductase [Planctomycetes bacterium]|nr:Gfo/Idh/MocA family oxidoreductase [Planctomycetota bacterium]